MQVESVTWHVREIVTKDLRPTRAIVASVDLTGGRTVVIDGKQYPLRGGCNVLLLDQP